MNPSEETELDRMLAGADNIQNVTRPRKSRDQHPSYWELLGLTLMTLEAQRGWHPVRGEEENCRLEEALASGLTFLPLSRANYEVYVIIAIP